MLSINTNISSLNTQRRLAKSQSGLATSLERLSSGLRINSAKDDAAGMAIGDRMTAQIRGQNQACRNVNDGISMAQTAEGAAAEMNNILQRIRELAVQSANGTNTSSDRQSLQGEVSQLTQEFQRIAKTSEFNGMKLLDGSIADTTFQVGANVGDTISTRMPNLQTNGLGLYRMGARNYVSNRQNDQGTEIVGYIGVYQTYPSCPNLFGVNTPYGSQIKSGTMTITNALGTTSLGYPDGASAKDAAQLINSANVGITARARSEIGFTSSNGNTTLDLITESGTVTLSFDVVGGDYSQAIASFNSVSSRTGITASIFEAWGTTRVMLTNNDGQDIKIINQSSAAQNITLSDTMYDDGVTVSGNNGVGTIAQAVVVTGELTLDSSSSFTASDTNPLELGGFVGTSSSVFQSLELVDVSTVGSCQRTLAITDAALQQVNTFQAQLGAVQNRFESVVQNLLVSTENLSASRSRIMDTDYAAETSKLSRNRILQQAGTAMLAQANSSPQQVLSLLPK